MAYLSIDLNQATKTSDLAFWHVLVDFSGCFQHGQITIVMAPYFSDMADQNPDGHGRVAGIIVAF